MKLEERLKHALRSNDTTKIHKVFNDIYEMYHKLIYFIIAKYVNDSEDIKDLVQETFISFYNNLNYEIKNIKYYLIVSAKNKAINFNLKYNKIILDEDFVYNAVDIKESSLDYQKIIEEMKKILTDLEIEIILQHTIYNLKFIQIANKYDLNVNTVISMYRRAIKKFKKGVNDSEKNNRKFNRK